MLVTEGRSVRLLRECLPCDVAAFRRAAAQGRLEDAAALFEADFLSVLSDCIRPGTDNREVYVRSGNGAPPEPITTNPGEDIPVGWSPDGAWALFLSDAGSEPGAHHCDAHALGCTWRACPAATRAGS